MKHAETICRDLEAHPGSTWVEVTLRTRIPSPHRRVTGRETPKGWTLRTERRGKLFVHFAVRSSEVVGGGGSQGPSGPVPPHTGTAAGDLERPDPSEAELSAALAKLGLDRPQALR